MNELYLSTLPFLFLRWFHIMRYYDDGMMNANITQLLHSLNSSPLFRKITRNTVRSVLLHLELSPRRLPE